MGSSIELNTEKLGRDTAQQATPLAKFGTAIRKCFSCFSRQPKKTPVKHAASIGKILNLMR